MRRVRCCGEGCFSQAKVSVVSQQDDVFITGASPRSTKRNRQLSACACTMTAFPAFSLHLYLVVIPQ